MKLNDGRTIRWLKDEYDSGYGGHGYGGSQLWVTYILDRFDPPLYVLRADSWYEAYEVAQECLAETLDEDLEAEAAEGDWLTWSASGRPISSDDDIRVYPLELPTKREQPVNPGNVGWLTRVTGS